MKNSELQTADNKAKLLEARDGVEPTNKGFADLGRNRKTKDLTHTVPASVPAGATTGAECGRKTFYFFCVNCDRRLPQADEAPDHPGFCCHCWQRRVDPDGRTPANTRQRYQLASARCPACDGLGCPDCSHTGQAEFCGADVFERIAQRKEAH